MKIGFINIPFKEDFSIKSIFGFEKTFVNLLLASAILGLLAVFAVGVYTF